MNIKLTSATNNLLKEQNLTFKKATEAETNDISVIFRTKNMVCRK